MNLVTGDSKLSRFFGIDVSSKGIDPAKIVPNSECNPAIFVQGAVPSSKIDEVVDNCN